MHKIILSLVLISTLITGCSGADLSTPTEISRTATPTPLPALESTLLDEIKLATETGTAYTLAWSHDGETLAVASGFEITLLTDGLKQIQAVIRPENGALGVTWKPDGTQFATVNGFRNPIITLWDFDGDNQLAHVQNIQADSDQYGVAWSPNGKILATLAGDKKSVIQLWNTSTWEMTQEFDLPYTNPRRALSWSGDSSTLYSAGQATGETVVFALNVTDGNVEELGKFPVAEAEVFAVSPDASQIAISDPRGVVIIVDIASGETIGGFKSVNESVDMAWNPNGGSIAILSYDGTLQLWEITR